MGRPVYEVHGPGEAREHCIGGTLQSVGATHAGAHGHSPIHVLRLVAALCRGRRGGGGGPPASTAAGVEQDPAEEGLGDHQPGSSRTGAVAPGTGGQIH